MRIGVLAAPSSWHFLDLQRSGAEQHEIINLSFNDLATEFGLSHDSDDARFRNGEVDLRELDRLIVRTMPAGSLQQIVFRMDLLGRLKSSGVKIINSPKTIEIAVDKYLSLSLLAQSNIAVPPTAVAESLPAALDCFSRLGGDVVYKPIFGSMGKGIIRINDREAASQFFEAQIADGQIIYLQKFIDHGDWDLRILVVGEQTFSIKRQRKGHWLTNIARGGTGTPHQPTKKELNLAFAAAKATGCRVAGIDIFYDQKTATPMVCDVNAAPGWKATSSTLNQDIAKRIIAEVAKM